MSESGDSGGRKPAPRAESEPSGKPRLRPRSHVLPRSSADDLVMWEDTTKVSNAAELMREAESEAHASATSSPHVAPAAPPRAVARVSVEDHEPGRFAPGPTGMEMGRPIFAVAAVGLLACSGAWLLIDVAAARGVAVGTAFATANLWAFTRIGQGVLGRNPTAWGLIAAAKLVLLFGGALAVLTTRQAAPLPFLVGYVALPVGVVLSQLLGLKSEFEDDEGSI